MGFWTGLAVGYILHGGRKRGPHPKSIKARLRRRRAQPRTHRVVQNKPYRDPRDFWTR